MGYVIEITESKYDKLVDNAEKMLRYGGKVMQCLDELCEDSHYGERMPRRYGDIGMRNEGGNGRYGRGMGMREHEDWDEDDWERDPMMGERRRRSSRTGRYIRG